MKTTKTLISYVRLSLDTRTGKKLVDIWTIYITFRNEIISYFGTGAYCTVHYLKVLSSKMDPVEIRLNQ